MKKNYLKVKVVGKHINNYVKWLIKEKIPIIEMKKINSSELNLIVYYEDYYKLSKYSITYKITILKKYGVIRIKEFINQNIIILTSLILSVLLLYFLSNCIFSIDIVYNDQKLSNLIKKELAEYDIKEYTFKKKYQYLDEVKKNILKKNNDILEWIEIKESGTKYIIKLVERKKENITKEYEYQSIVSNKNAIIKSIKAYNGEKTQLIDQYVKKDNTIISGIMTKPDGTQIYTKAKGQVLGEVWYKVSIEYPLYYKEEQLTGKSKEIVAIQIFNKKIPILPYKKYKQFKSTTTTILENNIIPIKLIKEKIYELHLEEEIYTEETAVNKAIEISKNKMKNGNDKIIKFNDFMVLKKENQNSKIKLELFISVIEDITKVVEIIQEQEE